MRESGKVGVGQVFGYGAGVPDYVELAAALPDAIGDQVVIDECQYYHQGEYAQQYAFYDFTDGSAHASIAVIRFNYSKNQSECGV